MSSHPIAFRLIKGSDNREDGSTLNGVVSFFLHMGVGTVLQGAHRTSTVRSCAL